MLARVKVEGIFGVHRARLRQFGDNLPVVAACNKGLSTAAPLSFALVTLAFACLEKQVLLDLSHVAGERKQMH